VHFSGVAALVDRASERALGADKQIRIPLERCHSRGEVWFIHPSDGELMLSGRSCMV
jgi:hypothetical protein